MENKKEQQKVVVAACIRDDKGKILLAKRVDFLNLKANGKWEFPGGEIEFGELALEPKSGRVLPAGIFARWRRAV